MLLYTDITFILFSIFGLRAPYSTEFINTGVLEPETLKGNCKNTHIIITQKREENYSDAASQNILDLNTEMSTDSA